MVLFSCPSVCLSVCVSVCMNLWMYVCLSVFFYSFAYHLDLCCLLLIVGCGRQNEAAWQRILLENSGIYW